MKDFKAWVVIHKDGHPLSCLYDFTEEGKDKAFRHKPCMAACSIEAVTVTATPPLTTDAVERVRKALKWALDYIADGTNPAEGETPEHDCEFGSDPERGDCTFHREYFEAVEILASLPAKEG